MEIRCDGLSADLRATVTAKEQSCEADMKFNHVQGLYRKEW